MISYFSLQDQALVDLITSKDEQAFKEVYERYFDRLFIHAYRRLNNKEEAQDIIHEIFISLWNRTDTIELKTSLSAYLYTTVRNKVINIISRKKIHSNYTQSLQNFIDQESTYETDHLVRENELVAIIDKEISNLPKKMNEIFQLSRKQNLSHKEIGEQLNLSPHTVKKQINNALKILRVKLGIFNILLFFIR